MSKNQLLQDGLTGPHELADKSGLDAACEAVLELKAQRRQQLRSGQPATDYVNPLIDRHMDIDAIRDVFFDANLQAVVSEYFANDLFLWRSNFFVKSNGTGQNKWHHDRHFENGNAPINLYDTSNHFTITVALTDIDMNAGRIEYLKGSHLPIEGFDRDIPRHILEVPEVVQDRVTPLPLERGQFVVFYSTLLHRSLEFGKGDRRISVAGRLARNGTEFPEDGAPNPAGGAHSAAEPIVHYRTSGILPYN